MSRYSQNSVRVSKRASRRAGAALLAGAALMLLPAPGKAQTPTTYTITTVAGNGTHGASGEGVAATDAQLWGPTGVAVDSAETIYIDDSTNERLRQVPASGVISTAVGNGVQGYAGDGGVATLAEIGYPCGVVVDPSGNFYIADWENTVRKVTPADIITTVAGTGAYTAGSYPLRDGGIPTTATLAHPCGLAMDPAGDIFIADSDNHLIRKIRADGQLITTVAGFVNAQDTGGVAGFDGDGGLATYAHLNSPQGVAVDAAGRNLYIADTLNHRIRKVSLANGCADGVLPSCIITTVAGSGLTGTGAGAGGFSGDGGPAVGATLNRPFGLAFDSKGNLFIADQYNNRIRMIDTNGIITTVAGNGVSGYLGDGGPATSAELWQPKGIAVSPASGRIYFSDTQNSVVRMLTPPSTTPNPFVLGVVTASEFGGFSTVAPGTWVEIYGSKLAPSAAAWDFSGGTAPTTLNGTSVIIGGLQAHLSYVSPGQVNAFVPVGLANPNTVTLPAPESVMVATAAGSSNQFAVTVNPTAPGFWAPAETKFNGRTQYVGAIFQDNSTCGAPTPATPCFVLPAGAPVSFYSRPARPGDVITIYGVGFGPVVYGAGGAPTLPDGQVTTQANTLATTLDVLFNGTLSVLNYAGLALNSVGVYEFDVVVPAVPASNAMPLTFNFGNTTSTQTLYIAISD